MSTPSQLSMICLLSMFTATLHVWGYIFYLKPEDMPLHGALLSVIFQTLHNKEIYRR